MLSKPFKILSAEDVPSRLTPRLIIRLASSLLRIPPDALTGKGDEYFTIISIPSGVAPLELPSLVLKNPVEDFTKTSFAF